MKKLLFLLWACALPFASLFAQTDDERAAAVAYLEKTEAGLRAATDGLSSAQLTYKPAPERWSVAEVIEHLAVAEDFFFDMIVRDAMHAPSRTDSVDLKALDALVISAVTDRSHKAQAPEPLMPTHRFSSAEEALQHFHASRAKTIAFLAEKKDLRAHATDSPLGQKLDGYQWLLLIGAHSERHTKQALEVKADPKFPKA